MTTERRRGRPRGYPKKKVAVLRAIADEAVAPEGAFILAQAVRRALGTNGCHCHESAVRDHSRSYRLDEAALLDAARQRRCPLPVPVRASASYASAVMADYVRQMRMGPARASDYTVAQRGIPNGLAQPSQMTEWIRKAEQEFHARMQAMQENPLLAAAMTVPRNQQY